MIILLLLLLFGCYEDSEQCNPYTQHRKTIVQENNESKCIYCNSNGYWEECEMATVTVNIK
ncbi:MAG: hypothetical protein GY853_15305 [PVC group bacterium]|nr:hypothetical protein [PVC group bacterium]